MQQGLASLVQILTSIFYYYKIVMAIDETTWSRPIIVIAQGKTYIV